MGRERRSRRRKEKHQGKREGEKQREERRGREEFAWGKAKRWARLLLPPRHSSLFSSTPSSLRTFPSFSNCLPRRSPIPPPSIGHKFRSFPSGDVANARGGSPSKTKNNCSRYFLCCISHNESRNSSRKTKAISKSELFNGAVANFDVPNTQQMGRTLRRRQFCPRRNSERELSSSVTPSRMGNLLNIRTRHARSQMRNGIKQYQQQNPQQAIRQWRAALRRLKSVEDKFITIGYIVQAFCDSGEFEQMLYAAVEQVDLANCHQDDFMKSEALLNLARANERLAEFEKAIGYADSSLELPGIDRRSPGYAHLVLALAHMGLSNFQSSLQQFEKAMKIANANADKLLELQLSLGLGNLFTLIRDLNKALVFLQNALGILQGIEANHVHAKYKSAILYQLSVILRLKGRYSEAREVCEESMELAKKVGNKPVFARALASLADICSELGETEARETVTKSWARYEQAFRLLRKLNDRMGQVTVLAQMAKSAAENKGVHYAGRCECQAIQLNKKCLEMATLIGAKHPMMECHQRLQELYIQLSDNENAEQSARDQSLLVREMELFCNFCGQRYGEADESLQALSCSHIFHERCLQKFFVRLGESPTTCPKCRSHTSLMENISLSSSNAQTPANETDSNIAEFGVCPLPTDPCTSAASTSAQMPIPAVVLCERNFDDSRWKANSHFGAVPSPSSATTEMASAERRICLSTSTVSSTCSFSMQQKGGKESDDGTPKNGQNGRGQKRREEKQRGTAQPIATLSTLATQKENALSTDPNNGTDCSVWHSEFEADDANIALPLSSLGGGAKQKTQPNHLARRRRTKKTTAPPSTKGLLALGRERMAAISPVAEEEEEEDEADREDRHRSAGGGRPAGEGATEGDEAEERVEPGRDGAVRAETGRGTPMAYRPKGAIVFGTKLIRFSLTHFVGIPILFFALHFHFHI
ncbi:hypothetical protein niasHT_005776 [Heterodera trifolii]|uniref:RING-type domain-containing protein n=1 Tax=Heterodera trifolii TaxID=157864 RepID=A0ABD2LTL6_9BILA